MNRIICIPDLNPFISDESEYIQFLFDEDSCIHKCDAGNATNYWAQKFIDTKSVYCEPREIFNQMEDIVCRNNGVKSNLSDCTFII